MQNIKSTITDRYFDITKIVKDLGFVQAVDIEKGISDTIKWYKLKSLI